MWYTALLMGLAGSLHCAGMCSPLLMAVTNLTPHAALNRFVYNGGRIATYGVLGALFSSVDFLFPISRYAGILSVVFGVVLVVLAIFRADAFQWPYLTRGVGVIATVVKQKFSAFLTKKHRGAVFILGMLNGLLPCGMTFVALSYCLLLPGPAEGFAYMFYFGVGTLPVMLGFTSVMGAVLLKWRGHLATITTGMLVLSGLLLIARVFVHPQSDDVKNEGAGIVICR